MRQTRHPFGEDAGEGALVEAGGDPLCQRGVGPAAQAVIERFVGGARLGELAFEELVAVETDLHQIRRLAAELDEQRAEGRGARTPQRPEPRGEYGHEAARLGGIPFFRVG